jgi:hypothetical protein
MGRVDERGNALRAQIGGQPFGAAEAADARRHRLGDRRRRAAGKREHYRHVGTTAQALRKAPGFESAAQDEDPSHGDC